jgi:branched-chain amino acid aminotransferase
MPSFAFFEKKFVPFSDAKISVMTHAFNYGTAVFEGIRGNWNAEEQQLYLFRVKEHYQRLLNSCRILKINIPYTVDDLCRLTIDLVKMNEHRDDVYIRPLAYKSSAVIGVKLHDLQDELVIFTAALPAYLDVSGARCQTSSWRRIDDTMVPARAKVTGLYVNSALAKTEANENGFDEAIMLTYDGHVSEGSGENIFMVEKGHLVTPRSSDNILVGITRDTVIQLAKIELGIETIERSVDRSELYVAEECFMTGTAAHVTPIIEIDRRKVGNGKIGPTTARLQELYFGVVRGKNKKYADWCTAVYPALSKVHTS